MGEDATVMNFFWGGEGFQYRSLNWRPRLSTPAIFYCIFSYSFHFTTWMVTHPSAIHGPSCLTSVILRKLVFPTWYCRSYGFINYVIGLFVLDNGPHTLDNWPHVWDNWPQKLFKWLRTSVVDPNTLNRIRIQDFGQFVSGSGSRVKISILKKNNDFLDKHNFL